ncbi:MAG: 16S rRNA (cytosine(1402)-N(4))-methyltransferase RsmH [Chitinophagales bacterium]
MDYHVPVMLNECVEALAIKKDGIYVDVTFGGGGHSKAIDAQLDGGKLFAFDQDTDAQKNCWDSPHLNFINQNFRHLKRYLKLYNAIPIQGLFADLGISSHQIDVPERGFSFRYDADLDMRMGSAEISAADILNTYSPEQIAKVLWEYGELGNSRKLAAEIVAFRGQKSFKRINDLLQVLEPFAGSMPNKFYARVFQALRMEVNQELDALKEMLEQSLEVLDTGGRLVVLSYHSLEDRLVKNFMKTGRVDGVQQKDFYGNIERPFRVITKKPMLPSKAEVKRNSRARSAKLRIAEKVKL